jgi:hypothetical protein
MRPLETEKTQTKTRLAAQQREIDKRLAHVRARVGWKAAVRE